MRAYEFLVEYDQQKTVNRFAPLIAQKVQRDDSIIATPVVNPHGGDQTELTLSIITKLEQADPTPHKEYMVWLATNYAKSDVKLEDLLSRGADALAKFDKLKRRKKLAADQRDINRLSFSDLEDLVMSFNEEDTELQNKKVNANKVFEDSDWLVVVPLDEEASKKYGAGTKWCTAADNNNMFGRYNSQGNLYILIPKYPSHTGEKYQFHFETNSFMDEHDKQLSCEKFESLIDDNDSLAECLYMLPEWKNTFLGSMDNSKLATETMAIERGIHTIKELYMVYYPEHISTKIKDELDYYAKNIQFTSVFGSHGISRPELVTRFNYPQYVLVGVMAELGNCCSDYSDADEVYDFMERLESINFGENGKLLFTY